MPPSVEHSLTPLGRTLLEPLSALADWAVRHDDEIRAARERAARDRAARAAGTGRAAGDGPGGAPSTDPRAAVPVPTAGGHSVS
ncbi:winged helix-turn-helix transcriptional regulator [Streptomyces carpaticus]|uniref:Winged helix-turn-helix transcriptional regulator n=1 Tax=Streptomyces carpaticus TaxID=285558 RepID=A0ABV4ZNT1_9ACTN